MRKRLVSFISTLSLVGVLFLISPLWVSTSKADTLVWDDMSVPFKQTFRFSTAETAIVHITIPAEVLTQSGRAHFFYACNGKSRCIFV